MWEISLVADDLLASQEILCIMEKVSSYFLLGFKTSSDV
jgi:hypothetical protein